MPSPPQGPTDRRFNAEPSTELPDEHAATVPAPSGPPPLPLIRRKVQAEAAPLPGSAPWQRAVPVTAPWPTPPSSRTPGDAHAASEESAEASTPFASAVDIMEEDSRATETPEPEPDFRARTNPWWRRLKAPSRQVQTGALIAALAAAVGWSAGAKPWASHRATSQVAAAKPGAKAGKHSPVAHGPQAAAHANRRVAVNAKAKPAPAAPAHAKATAKPAVATKPSAKQSANPTQRALAKTATNKAPNKTPAKAKATTPGKKSAVTAKAKSVSAPSATTKAKAHPSN